MVHGRPIEKAAIDRLLAGAREGRSGTLVLRGEPGIGKSALCRLALERAEGFRVLEAWGARSETELPFAALTALLRPVLGGLDRLPPTQAAALRGALALGPAVPGDPLTTRAATLSLLAEAAEARPLLVIVDDLHLVDRASAAALLFAVRRLDAEGIAVVLTVRPGQDEELDLAGLPAIAVEGLDRAASDALLGPGVDPEVAECLHCASAGNPLAVRELAGLLGERVLAGVEPLPEPLPPPATAEAAFAGRVAALPPAAREAMLLVAASETGATELVVAALARLGLPPEALEPAEAAGLLALGPERIEPAHPLALSVAYHGAAPPARRAAHRALAAALEGVPRAASRAWHLAAAAVGPDEGVAAALEHAADDARARGAFGPAARAMQAAARLTPDDETRVRRLIAAGRDALLTGHLERAAALAEDALAHTADPLPRADAQLLRGQLELLRGSPRQAHMILAAAARDVEAVDRERAATLAFEAVPPLLLLGDFAAARDAAERARGLEAVPSAAPALTLGGALVALGEAAAGARHVREGAARLTLEQLMFSPHGVSCVVFLGWIEEHDLARDLLDRTIAAARSAGTPALLPLALGHRAELALRTGELLTAHTAAWEASRLAEQIGQSVLLPYLFALLARVEALRGHEPACRATADRARRLGAEQGDNPVLASVGAAIGLMELGLDRPDRAVPALADAVERLARSGVHEPAVLPCLPDLVEACARSGDHAGAQRALAALAGGGESASPLWAAHTAARCRGLLAGELGYERHFAEALESPYGGALERARTELCFGERLRRSRRLGPARGRLERALSAFESVGAEPWAERARRELRAAGGQALKRPPGARLTPQELQVAQAVGAGATNREVAAALFLSPKTVEAHLSRVYRKLAVRSRSELASLLATGRHPGDARPVTMSSGARPAA